MKTKALMLHSLASSVSAVFLQCCTGDICCPKCTHSSARCVYTVHTQINFEPLSPAQADQIATSSGGLCCCCAKTSNYYIHVAIGDLMLSRVWYKPLHPLPSYWAESNYLTSTTVAHHLL